jgi:hypothetical protein
MTVLSKFRIAKKSKYDCYLCHKSIYYTELRDKSSLVSYKGRLSHLPCFDSFLKHCYPATRSSSIRQLNAGQTKCSPEDFR